MFVIKYCVFGSPKLFYLLISGFVFTRNLRQDMCHDAKPRGGSVPWGTTHLSNIVAGGTLSCGGVPEPQQYAGIGKGSA